MLGTINIDTIVRYDIQCLLTTNKCLKNLIEILSNKDYKNYLQKGLCKLASCKGSDTSVKLLADGSNAKLEAACRK